MQAMQPVDAKPGDPQYQAASEFARRLEAYVLATTGIAVALKLNGANVSVSGKDFEKVQLDNPVQRISLVHIHLPLMDGRAPLWAAALDNTWPSETDDFKLRMRRALRPLLESEGIRPGIWPLFGSHFRFSLIFKAQAERFLKQQQGERPDPVPSWQDYVKTDMGDSVIIGLRLAHYDHANHVAQAASHTIGRSTCCRNSFANANSTKAFDSAREYPGSISHRNQRVEGAGQGHGRRDRQQGEWR